MAHELDCSVWRLPWFTFLGARRARLRVAGGELHLTRPDGAVVFGAPLAKLQLGEQAQFNWTVLSDGTRSVRVMFGRPTAATIAAVVAAVAGIVFVALGGHPIVFLAVAVLASPGAMMLNRRERTNPNRTALFTLARAGRADVNPGLVDPAVATSTALLTWVGAVFLGLLFGFLIALGIGFLISRDPAPGLVMGLAIPVSIACGWSIHRGLAWVGRRHERQLRERRTFESDPFDSSDDR